MHISLINRTSAPVHVSTVRLSPSDVELFVNPERAPIAAGTVLNHRMVAPNQAYRLSEFSDDTSFTLRIGEYNGLMVSQEDDTQGDDRGYALTLTDPITPETSN